MSVPSPSALRGYQIGEAARQSGMNPASIPVYEKEKLLSPYGRGDNSYRLYSEGDVHPLRFIRLCRAMDMSLDEVCTLLGLDLNNKTDCAAPKKRHIQERMALLDFKTRRGRRLACQRDHRYTFGAFGDLEGAFGFQLVAGRQELDFGFVGAIEQRDLGLRAVQLHGFSVVADVNHNGIRLGDDFQIARFGFDRHAAEFGVVAVVASSQGGCAGKCNAEGQTEGMEFH